jgi:hypothetical protein
MKKLNKLSLKKLEQEMMLLSPENQRSIVGGDGMNGY